MIVKSLELADFRNYEAASISFSEQTNILYGNNAQGKTNLLEAIYLCATTKSHKGAKDRELIRFGKEEAHLRISLMKKAHPYRIDLHLKKNRPKGIAIDGLPVKKSTELFGIVNVITFSPEDLSMIKNGPGERRRFLDLELCQLDKLYLHHLILYTRALNQRNSLLKQAERYTDMSVLDVWDEELLRYGLPLIAARRQFIEQLQEITVKTHQKLTGGAENLQLKYEANCTEEEFATKLRRNRERDLYLKMTNYGPHRDDIGFYVNGNELKTYGSQGQQRTCALSLKLSEIELVRKLIDDTPVLLLDDVLSELDRSRQIALLESIREVQTIVTCTGLEEFVAHRTGSDAVFHVIEGTIDQITDQ